MGNIQGRFYRSSLVDCSLVEREVAQSHRLQRESFVKTFVPRVVLYMEGPAAREACLKMGPELTLQAIPNPYGGSSCCEQFRIVSQIFLDRIHFWGVLAADGSRGLLSARQAPACTGLKCGL